MFALKTPLNNSDILNLKAGDEVLLSGTIFTARDKAHQFLLKNSFSKIKNGVVYHCGPVVKGNQIIAAGPTTSARLNYYTPKLINKYAIKAVIGKGGMDVSVLNALRGKAVYLAAIGGAGVLYADKIKLKDVYKKEFGPTEAIYEFEVTDFPLIVGMDALGTSLYDEVAKKSKVIFEKLID